MSNTDHLGRQAIPLSGERDLEIDVSRPSRSGRFAGTGKASGAEQEAIRGTHADDNSLHIASTNFNFLETPAPENNTRY